MAGEFGYEIDFLKVGDGERSGDAIAVRYGTPGAYRVMVVDGGSKESGQALVDHIKGCYKTNRVDYLVNTHPDSDHASGLEVVLENLQVGEAWVHRPWNYPEQIIHWFKDGRITVNSLRDRLEDALYHAYRIEELALEKNIPVREPFQGSKIGEFYVVSPSRDWYLNIIAHFNKTPEPKYAQPASNLQQMATLLAEKAKTWLEERWDFETLKDDVTTSYDNESSVVLYANLADRGILLTGDAGVEALTHAVGYLESFNIDLPNTLKFMQIPHHGSRNNVNPSVLNRLVGSRVPLGSEAIRMAFVSAGAKSETHPRKVVTNAFKRRGCKVIEAKGVSVSHYYKMGRKDGWGQVDEVPFFDKVES